jgi:hypothetical protein
VIDISFIVTIRVQGKDEAECWRLFNQKLEDGKFELRIQEMYREPENVISTARRSTIIPPNNTETIPVPTGRNGDTLPSMGSFKVKHNLQEQQR